MTTLPKRVASLGLVALSLSWMASSAVAQNAPALPPGYDRSMPPPGRYEAELERLLASQEYDALFHAVVADVDDMHQAERGLNWLLAKQVGQGGGSLIAFLYSALLWRAAASHAEPDKSSLSESAIVQYYVAKLIIHSEGFQCEDDSSPGARMDLVDAALEEVGQGLMALSEEDRKRLARLALARVVSTFKVRENDVWLCNGGAALYSKYFAKHPDEKGKQVDSGASLGKEIVLPHDPSILPDFVPYGDWKDHRHTALDQMADGIGEKRLNSYGDEQHRMK